MSTYMSTLNQLRDAELAELGTGWNVRASLENPAKARWLALRSLSDNPQECELRDAGVSERRIQILYEPEFTDLVSGLVATIKPEDYLQLDGSEDWTKHQEGIRYLYRARRTVDQETIEVTAFQSSTEARALRDHILKCLPVGKLDIKRASAMTESLWFAHWVMANIKDYDESLEELYYQFTTVCDWVLPQLVKEVS